MEEVTFKIEKWNWEIGDKAKQSHSWTDALVSLVSTAKERVLGRKEGSRLLTGGAEIGPSEVVAWAKHLKTEEGKRDFSLVESWLHPLSSKTLAKKSAEEVANAAADILKESLKEAPEGGLLYVPLIIGGEGLFEPHHLVWVTADLEMKRVEYYDPKGTGLENQESASYRLVTGVIAGLLRVSGFKRVRENLFRHQKDIHNCGVFGMFYMDKRRNESFITFIQHKDWDMQDERRLMAGLIQSHGGSETLMNF